MVTAPPESKGAIQAWIFGGALAVLAVGVGGFALKSLLGFSASLQSGSARLLLDPWDCSAVIMALGLLITAGVVVIPAREEVPKVRRRSNKGKAPSVAVVWFATVLTCVVLAGLAPSLVRIQGERLTREAGYRLCAPLSGERRGPMRWVKGDLRNAPAQCPQNWREAEAFDKNK